MLAQHPRRTTAAGLLLSLSGGALLLQVAPGIANAVDPPVLSLSATPQVIGGNAIEGEVTSDLPCDWSISYDGDTSTSLPIEDSGQSVSFTIETEPVDVVTEQSVSATCTYEDDEPDPEETETVTATATATATETVTFSEATETTETATATATVTFARETLAKVSEERRAVRKAVVVRSVDVTLLPVGSSVDDPGGVEGAGAGLPNTGGPNWLLGGFGLVLVFAGAIVVGRSQRPVVH
ncbi:hypothetical protein ASE01_03665 [Nocardioides sp. Root190]|uniref:hypothetical protein n=1 Tax=Nocardioides sp. Root190 TaxID=1736488 RepID=UPI0006FAFDD7|nr:hypothetical protein [Nocardioides sp. Root190]KRB78384.1 hypothetical protein ASE01_03665 [Nocardioides sp. Root190]